MYIKSICDLGGIIQVGKHYPGNYGAPGMSRSTRKKATPEEIVENNHRARVRRLQRIILANFREGRSVTLTYEQRPGSLEEAMRDRQNFMKKMRRICKKAGVDWKWIVVTERGKKGQALHHHLIIEDLQEPLNLLRAVEEAWTKGRVRGSRMKMGDDCFETLAGYLAKEEGKPEQGMKFYSHSRNLVIPKEKRLKVNARKWREEPKAPSGWYVVKGSVWNGYTPAGWPVQRYTLRRAMDNMDNSKNAFR